MFKKPLAHQSNATPLRSSARRQLLASLVAQYPNLIKGADGNDNKEVVKMVLPEGVRAASFKTSGGVQGEMWLSPAGDPLWMSFGRNSMDFVPTLHLLSLPLPKPPLPLIELHHPLPSPILTGAPLFIAAVKHLRRPWLLPDVRKDAIVAFVAATGSPSELVSYVGVGRVVAEGGMRGAVERRAQVLEEGLEVDEGKFCDILCIVGDHLGDVGSQPVLPAFDAPRPLRPLVPDREAGPSRSPAASPGEAAVGVEALSLEQNGNAPQDDSAAREPLSPSEISTLLSIALIQALSNLSPTSLPMPASTLYSAHVLPCRPAFIPQAQRDDVVIGKSEWKKLAKWMKEVSKDGLIKTKESKGEVTVTGIDATHPSIETHAPHLTIAEEEAKAAKRAAREAAAASEEVTMDVKGKGKGKEIPIEELWKPSSSSLPFWEACGIDKTKLNPPGLIKSALEDYAAKHNLIDRAEPRYLLLDDELGRACSVKRPEPGQRMSRDEILRKLRAGVVWSVSIGGVVKKGTLQPVTMTVRTRQGRKTVTVITGLETFSIAPDEFAEELKKLCAGSTTVSPLQGASPKLNLSEVMVQGSQVKVVTEALVARGVPKKWIKKGDKK